MKRKFDDNYNIEKFIKSSNDIVEYIKRLEEQITEKNGSIQELIKFPAEPSSNNLSADRSYYERSNILPQELRDKANKWLDECKSIHEKNKPIVENNIKVVAKARAYMESIGLPTQVTRMDYGKTGRAQGKRVSERAGWVVSLDNVPIYQQDISYYIIIYNKIINKANECEQKDKEEKEKKQRANEIIEENRRKQVDYLTSLIKMEIPEHTEPADALDLILEKNKYLRLAYFLEKNRNDWNDGCDYAETGLSGFAVESDEDREIYKCVAGLYGEGWDGDGRVFRDCKYNYGELYKKVQEEDPELMECFRKISKLIVEY